LSNFADRGSRRIIGCGPPPPPSDLPFWQRLWQVFHSLQNTPRDNAGDAKEPRRQGGG